MYIAAVLIVVEANAAADWSAVAREDAPRTGLASAFRVFTSDVVVLANTLSVPISPLHFPQRAPGRPIDPGLDSHLDVISLLHLYLRSISFFPIHQRPFTTRHVLPTAGAY